MLFRVIEVEVEDEGEATPYWVDGLLEDALATLKAESHEKWPTNQQIAEAAFEASPEVLRVRVTDDDGNGYGISR